MHALLALAAILLLAASVVATILLGPQLRSLFLDRSGTAKLPYKARPLLLSKGEAAFYHTLRRAVGDQHDAPGVVEQPPAGEHLHPVRVDEGPFVHSVRLPRE